MLRAARCADGTSISAAVSTSHGSGRELIRIADKNSIKVSYDDPALLEEVVRRLQPVKRVKIAEKKHNGFGKAYINIEEPKKP